MFRNPVPVQLAQFRDLFKHILGTPPPDELLPAFFTLLRSQIYRQYRIDLSQEVSLCTDIVANVGDRELIWYGSWDTTAHFWLRPLGLHIMPQYPLWRLRDGGSHPKLNDSGKAAITNWRAIVQAQAPHADQSHGSLFSLSSSISSDVNSFAADIDLDFSIDGLPPIEVSEERLDEMRIAHEASLGLGLVNAPDTSHLTAQTFDVSHPAIVRKRGDNSLIADFAVLTLQGDHSGTDNAPLPEVYRSTQEDFGSTMSEDLTSFLEDLGREPQGTQSSGGGRLGKHLSLARVLLLLEAKRHATRDRDLDLTLLESKNQVSEQARYCFDMPNVTRVVTVATAGDTWMWALLRKSKTAKTTDKNGGEMADVEEEIEWSKNLVLESQESENHWVEVVEVVRELKEEAEAEAEI